MACFQHLYSRWQKFIVAQGACLEENVAEMIAPFLYFSEIKLLREHFEAITYSYVQFAHSIYKNTVLCYMFRR
jgi:hypothetical protein